MSFKPCDYPDRWKGILFVLGLLLLDALFVRVAFALGPDAGSYLLGLCVLASLPVLIYVGYRTHGAFALEYWVERDGVTVVWGTMRQVVPMGEILRIQQGADLANGAPPRPWHFPCPDCRWMASKQLGRVRSYATRPLPEQVILVTASGNYGLSPSDPDAFIHALQERYRLGIAHPLQAQVQRPPLWTWALWRDRQALALIGLGLAGVLLLFGALCFRFPALSANLPLHFDANGLPDRIAGKAELFALPLIGLFAWGANVAAGILIYRQVQRQGAYLLWGGAVVVEIIAGFALRNLMRW